MLPGKLSSINKMELVVGKNILQDTVTKNRASSCLKSKEATKRKPIIELFGFTSNSLMI